MNDEQLQWEDVLFHLDEAREELERLTRELKDSDTRDEMELGVGLQHAYHHLNFAWNTRNTSSKRIEEMSDDDYAAWGRFPTDLPIDTLNEE